jgi:UDP-glucose 4-epimerase
LSGSRIPAVLVTGGAGFIGSVTALELSRRGFRPVLLDNLSTSSHFPRGIEDFYLGDIADRALLENLHQTYEFESIIHFAAKAYVEESIMQPHVYYQVNVGGSASFIRFALDVGINNFIFSSSCATYGVPVATPISELNEQLPISPYGRSKLMVEQILKDVAVANKNFKFIGLRYFNATGASIQDGIFEQHEPETHVIPLLLHSIKK